MHNFKNDYSEIAHPKILELMGKYNLEKNLGYGLDTHSTKAKEYLKKNIKNEDVDIHFIPGGTQSNLLAISSILRPHQAVISADTGHISVNETGAIERTGHKVVTVQNKDGKITTKSLLDVIDSHTNEHAVMPKMVYISNSTELGTTYSKNELVSLSEFCKEHNLILYMDGARLGSALTSSNNDLTLSQISKLVDAFYIGGTKNGAILGEAFVIVNEEYKRDFRYAMKQRGAMLAKGFVTGIQFEALFEDNLFFDLATKANQTAEQLRDVFKKYGYKLYIENYTNQIFTIFPNYILDDMSKEFLFEVEKNMDNENTVVRFVTSWATEKTAVEAMDTFLSSYKQNIER